MSITRTVKAEGTFEIRMGISALDRPCSRMSIDYVCTNCGDRRRLMRGGTPRRTVTIELSDEGGLLSVEVLHPDQAVGDEILDATPLPERAKCSACLQGEMLPDIMMTFC